MNVLKRSKRVVSVLMTLCLSGLVLTACGRGDDEEIKPLPIPEPIVIATPTPEPDDDLHTGPEQDLAFSDENMLNGIPIIGVREEVNGMYQSYLTGEWKDVEVAKRRAMALVMPNDSAALPKWGISRAGIVFEAAVEGRTSRLVAYFEDYDDLEMLGPARSARDYHVYDAIGKRAIFAHWGLAVAYCADLINGDKTDNVSQALGGITRGAQEAFFRRTRPGYKTEYTGYLDIAGYNRAVERLGYDKNYPADFVPQFTFAADGTFVEYENYPKASIIRPGTKGSRGGFGQGNASFEYNEQERLYYRYQFGGKHTDELNNEHLSYTNVVFQYALGEVRDAKDYLIFGLHGEGRAKVFTNGRVIEGTWKRLGGDHKPAKFYDMDDNEIVFNRGKTWICLIWETYAEFAVYE